MPNIPKPNDVNSIWAAAGDIAAPSAEYVSNGWEAIIPPREYFNWLDNRQDRFNAHVNQHGIPTWDSNTEYQANISYSKGSNGTVYRAVTTNSNVNPVGDTTGAWTMAFSVSGVQRFEASGFFTVPLNKTTVYVSATAGGGGGGGGARDTISGGGGGGGGGAGRSELKRAITVTPGQVINVVVGIGGIGGVGGTTGRGSDGQAGGNTLFGTLLVLAGGGAGRGGEVAALSGAGGQGGSPGGSWGTDGSAIDGRGGDGGAGGSGTFGTAGGAGRAGQGGGKDGTSATGFGTGGGGGGAAYLTASAGGAGSAGRPGLVIVEWV